MRSQSTLKSVTAVAELSRSVKSICLISQAAVEVDVFAFSAKSALDSQRPSLVSVRRVMSSISIEFPKQQARVRELLEQYQTIPTGAFGAHMLKDVLRRADQAMASGNVISILQSYKEMAECE